MLFSLSIGLALFAVALAVPVPIAFARAAWPSGAPVRALLLWQAIGLAGGFSMIGADIVLILKLEGKTNPLGAGVDPF